MDVKKIQERFRSAQERLVIQSSDLSLRSIADMVERKVIDLEPSFQRRHRWNAQQQSLLIESFVLNVPIPPIYLAEEEYGRYVVVDGKQRLAAVHRFMTGDLALEGLESFEELNGMTRNTLSPDIANALEVRPYMRVVTLLRQTDPDLKYEVFVRLNRGGESMEPQEVRKVAYRGPLTDLVYEMAGNAFLRKQLKIRDDDSPAFAKMYDAELVLRFFTIRQAWNSFSGAFQQELDSFNIKHRNATPSLCAKLRARFVRAMAGCEQLWGDHAFHRYEAGGWRNQLLAGMFDAQMVGVDLISDATLARAIGRKASMLSAFKKLCADVTFDRAVRVGTNTPDRVRSRIEAVKDLLSQA